MNRSSNLLNGSLLGTVGRSSKIFLQATQWSSAQVTALLIAGRKLIGFNTLKEASTSSALSGGRGMIISSTMPCVTNSVTLGSGRYLLSVSEEAQADTHTTIYAYRRLKCSSELNQVQTSSVLTLKGKLKIDASPIVGTTHRMYAGRCLKILSNSSLISGFAVLPKKRGVRLSSAPTLSIQGSTTLSKLQAVRLSVSRNFNTQSTVLLTKYAAIAMGASQLCKAVGNSILRKLVPVTMPISFTGSAWTSVSQLKGAPLRSVLTMGVQFNTSNLSESSKMRAPVKRTSYVLIANRTSVIPGN